MTDEANPEFTTLLSPTNNTRKLTLEEEDFKNRITQLQTKINVFSENVKYRKLTKLDLLDELASVCANIHQLLQDYNSKKRYPSTFRLFDDKLNLINTSYRAIRNLVVKKKQSDDKNISPEESASILGKCQSIQNIFASLYSNLGRQSPRVLRKLTENTVADAHNVLNDTRTYLTATMYTKEPKVEANTYEDAATPRTTIKVF